MPRTAQHMPTDPGMPVRGHIFPQGIARIAGQATGSQRHRGIVGSVLRRNLPRLVRRGVRLFLVVVVMLCHAQQMGDKLLAFGAPVEWWG